MILDKISTPNRTLDTGDLTPNQKKLLYDIMERHEAKQNFSYERFFRIGFREWELIGVEKAKRDFLKLHEKELWTEPDEDGDVGYAAILVFIDDGEHKFYDLIGRVRGLRSDFIEYMNDLGMGFNSVINKFGHDGEESFRDWERIGIRTIVKEFEAELEATGAV